MHALCIVPLEIGDATSAVVGWRGEIGLARWAGWGRVASLIIFPISDTYRYPINISGMIRNVN